MLLSIDQYVIFVMLSDRISYSFERCSSKIELSLQ